MSAHYLAPVLTGRRWTCVEWHGAPLTIYANRAEAKRALKTLPRATRWADPGAPVAPRLCVLCDGWHLLPVPT